MAQNAVVDTVNGYVKRYGFCDFTGDGSFDAATETQEALSDATRPPDGVPLRYLKIVAGAFVEMTTPEKATIDAVLLAALKAARSVEVDRRTLELAAAGVEYPAASGAYYSIDPATLQAFRLELEAVTADASFPFYWDSTDNSAAITVASEAMGNAVLLAAARQLRDIYQSGTLIKNQIRAAASKVALDAIVDPR
ncbi:MAG: hypothetical protein JSV86_18510 [Gemmatimonadota bacterium]|nr:MAG: hypothetical protein JSV86_18510 [Gemmatimonadota bacterium]